MTDFVHGTGGNAQGQFEELLAQRFPAIASQITEIERGLLHLKMAAFVRATCAAIDIGDFAEVKAHIAFIDELFQIAAPDLKNAIYVSYLENVFLGRDDECYESARSALSHDLRAALFDLEEHWKNIAEWHRNQSSDERRG